MRPFDAVFLAAAVALFFPVSRRDWTVTLVPLLAFGARTAPLQRFDEPLAALAACLAAPRIAPVALVLSTPHYHGMIEAILCGLLCGGLLYLTPSIRDRLEDSAEPRRIRGLPALLFCLAILYFALLPMAYL